MFFEWCNSCGKITTRYTKTTYFFIRVGIVENRFDGVSSAFGVRQWFSTGGTFVLQATFGMSEDICDGHDRRVRGRYYWHLVIRSQKSYSTSLNILDRPTQTQSWSVRRPRLQGLRKCGARMCYKYPYLSFLFLFFF